MSNPPLLKPQYLEKIMLLVLQLIVMDLRNHLFYIQMVRPYFLRQQISQRLVVSIFFFQERIA